MKSRTLLSIALLALMLVTSCCNDSQPKVKNVIYLIGDGMGFGAVSSLLLSEDEETGFEQAPVIGLSETCSADNYVTDSAAGGTALATGTRTNNGFVGADPEGNQLTSVLRKAQTMGMKTGIVVNTTLTEATPAAFYAGVTSRKKVFDIAKQFTESEVDVAIGGGLDHFINRPDFKDKLAAEEDGNEQGEFADGMPVMDGAPKVFNVNVQELSGLCLTVDKSALLSCGDQGVVKKISFNGEVSDFWEDDADMEGITIDPNTGNIYIAIEGAQKLYKLEAPDYNKYSSIFYVQEAVDKGYENSGLEGIDYYKDDIVFIGSQWGANLWQYRLDGTEISKVSLSGFASEVAGLHYDEVGDWLWVVDSKRAELYICTVAGKHLATYKLGNIENAESVCVDRDRGCVWIGSDEGSPKLYRFPFKF